MFVHIITRMKHIDTRIVPMQLKNKITPMKKGLTLTILLIAITFLALLPSNVSAQCENSARGEFYPLLGIQNSTNGKDGRLTVAKYQNIAGSNFPYFIEWREGSIEGIVIKSGEILVNLDAEPQGEDPRILENLEAGTYYLITYDSSVNCKKVITQTILK